jgi:O-antigen/teichoic acid export membrane protein/2-polyprenyl-3-methyl-5-hydroxy-6-metoxy-1,4-benzoquinol methylase
MYELKNHNQMLSSSFANRVRLLREGAINSFGFVVTRIIGILLVPFMLRGLGAELYGLWIVTLSVTLLISSIDLGLGWSITRVVSAAHDTETRNEAARFVSTAGNAFVIFGTVEAIFIGTLGFAFSGNLHLSSESQELAPAIFFLTGFALLANQVSAFAIGVLHGMRRFGVVNLLSLAITVLWASGVAFLLSMGMSIQSIVAWQAVTSMTMALAALVIVQTLEPRYVLTLGRFSLAALRPQISFGIMSQLSGVANKIVTEVPPLLIGIIHGSAAIVPYSIGQRFPLAISGIGSRATEILFPAASEVAFSRNLNSSKEILEVGTRAVVVLMLPLCLVLSLFAPHILRAWLGEVDPVALQVLRLTTAAVFVEAVGLAALNVLWGRGEATTVFIIYSGMAVVGLGITAGLLHRIGIVGAAWGVFVAMASGSCAFLHFSCRLCEVRVPALIHKISKGLLLPVMACATAALGSTYWEDPESWPVLALSVIGCGSIYAISLYFSGGREEERIFGREAIRLPTIIASSVYRRLRSSLRRVQFARSSWYLVLALVDCIRDNWRTSDSFNREFQRKVDPWGYAKWPCEQERHITAVEMLDAASKGERFGEALEVGCAEGIFTKPLATRCESLMAVDYSETALTRAREKLSGSEKVQFLKWNLRQDHLPGTYDLIAIMDVLSSFHRPKSLRAACRNLVEGLHAGGYLLVGDVRQSEVFESAWWGRILIRGAKQITASIGEHPELVMITTKTTDTHILTLFRKLT